MLCSDPIIKQAPCDKRKALEGCGSPVWAGPEMELLPGTRGTGLLLPGRKKGWRLARASADGRFQKCKQEHKSAGAQGRAGAWLSPRLGFPAAGSWSGSSLRAAGALGPAAAHPMLGPFAHGHRLSS